MKICNKCGHQSGDLDNFCAKCGTSFSDDGSESCSQKYDQVKICAKCGAKINADAKFCTICGASLLNEKTSVERSIAEKSDSLAWSVGSILWPLLGWILYFVYKNKDIVSARKYAKYAWISLGVQIFLAFLIMA